MGAVFFCPTGWRHLAGDANPVVYTTGVGVSRILILLLLGYVLADLSLPMVDGAFQFDPDESVECVRPEGAAAVPLAVVDAAPSFRRVIDETSARLRAPRQVPRLPRHEPSVARSQLLAASDPASSTDDH